MKPEYSAAENILDLLPGLLISFSISFSQPAKKQEEFSALLSLRAHRALVKHPEDLSQCQVVGP